MRRKVGLPSCLFVEDTIKNKVSYPHTVKNPLNVTSVNIYSSKKNLNPKSLRNILLFYLSYYKKKLSLSNLIKLPF